jgi:purine nucleosidase
LGYAKLPGPRSKPIGRHGCDFLIEQIMANPGEITLVAIGPLTNVALAIRQEPRIVHTLKELIIMGGAIRYEGNTTALAEFNTYVDPHAAHIVYHAGIPTTLVPLEYSGNVLAKADVDRLLRIDALPGAFVADSTLLQNFDEFQGVQGVINDPLALALTFARPVRITNSPWMWIFRRHFQWAKPSAILQLQQEARQHESGARCAPT